MGLKLNPPLLLIVIDGIVSTEFFRLDIDVERLDFTDFSSGLFPVVFGLGNEVVIQGIVSLLLNFNFRFHLFLLTEKYNDQIAYDFSDSILYHMNNFYKRNGLK